MLEHPGILRFPEFVHVLLASIVESPSAIIANPKQNVFVFPLCCAWAASLAFGGWLGCLVGCLACLYGWLGCLVHGSVRQTVALPFLLWCVGLSKDRITYRSAIPMFKVQYVEETEIE